MVLLVQHDAQAVLNQKRGARSDPSVRIQPGQLLTHQVALVQQLPIGALQVVNAELGRPPQEHGVAGCPLHGLEDILSLRL